MICPAKWAARLELRCRNLFAKSRSQELVKVSMLESGGGEEGSGGEVQLGLAAGYLGQSFGGRF